MTTPLQETIETLVFKYNIRREYFTILLPVLLGILLVLVAFLTGHTLTAQQQQATQTQQQQQLQQLINQMSGNNSTAPAAQTQQPQTEADLDHYIIYGTLVAITPFSIDRFFEKRRHKRYEDDFTQFLFKLSEMMRAGIDPIKSVIELSKSDMGSISPFIQSAASMMLLGRSFEEGMRSMVSSLHSDMATRYVDLVVQASYMGGSVHDLILKSSEDMRTMIMINREMEGNLQQYVIVLYLAQAIIVFIAYILSAQLIPFIQGTGSTMLFGSADLQNINFTQSFFHLIMINAAIGGLIVGKIAEGSIKDGFKHSAILIASCYVICVIFILPLGTPNNNYVITVVSGSNQTANPGMQLTNPIVFKLTDMSGNPQPGVEMQFNITPSGSVSPAFDKTDNSSQVSVNVIMGSNNGMYTVSAKVGATTKDVTFSIANGG
jgi:flagellar protein FlaJ